MDNFLDIFSTNETDAFDSFSSREMRNTVAWTELDRINIEMYGAP